MKNASNLGGSLQKEWLARIRVGICSEGRRGLDSELTAGNLVKIVERSIKKKRTFWNYSRRGGEGRGWLEAAWSNGVKEHQHWQKGQKKKK